MGRLFRPWFYLAVQVEINKDHGFENGLVCLLAADYGEFGWSLVARYHKHGRTLNPSSHVYTRSIIDVSIGMGCQVFRESGSLVYWHAIQASQTCSSLVTNPWYLLLLSAARIVEWQVHG